MNMQRCVRHNSSLVFLASRLSSAGLWLDIDVMSSPPAVNREDKDPCSGFRIFRGSLIPIQRSQSLFDIRP